MEVIHHTQIRSYKQTSTDYCSTQKQRQREVTSVKHDLQDHLKLLLQFGNINMNSNSIQLLFIEFLQNHALMI